MQLYHSPWNLLSRLDTSSTASFAACTGSAMIWWMSENNNRYIDNYACQVIEVMWRYTFRYLWPTRDCLVLHKVKHHHSHHQPGQEGNQGNQQLCRHSQFSEEPLTFGLERAGLCCRCSIGPNGRGGGGGFGSFMWKNDKNKRYRNHSELLVKLLLLGLTIGSATLELIGLFFYSL